MFEDRIDAGRKLAHSLSKYKDKTPIVIGLPMGGIEVGYEIAEEMGADFFVLVTLPLREFLTSGVTFGVVSEDGNYFYSDLAYDILSRREMDQIMETVKKDLPAKIKTLRGSASFPDLTGRTVILVDENAINGYSLRVAAEMCRTKGARKVIAATPVALMKATNMLRSVADDVIFLDDFDGYSSIGEVFKDWHELSEEEAILIWERWQLLQQMEGSSSGEILGRATVDAYEALTVGMDPDLLFDLEHDTRL